jgi:hypothetical protein
LKSVTYHIETSKGFRPLDSTIYNYNSSGNITSQKYFTYDVIEKKFNLFSNENFIYSNTRLSAIEKEIVAENGLPSTIHYEYTNDKISKIILDDQIDTEAVVTYPHSDTIQIVYSHSNGNGFTYRFSIAGNNIAYEETFDKWITKARETINEFDNRINPYSLLGYTDIFFTNFSHNNKTKSHSEYFGGIGFPESIPFSYEYLYNDDNLPTQQIISFKLYASGNIVSRAKVLFEYTQ